MEVNADSDPDRDRKNGAADREPSLAALIQEAEARGETEDALIDRVRASYDRDVPPRRVENLLEAERERLDRVGSEPVIEGHPPRYVDTEDLTYLTDAEFARVVTHLLGERDGHAEVIEDHGEAKGLDPDSTEEQAGSGDPTRGDAAENDRTETIENTEGVTIRWHRNDGVVFRAIAAEPGRLVDGQSVTKADEHWKRWERGRTERAGAGDSPGPAVVTVADLTPGAVRLAVRLGVEIYDRADVRRWLEEEQLTPETFGSLIELG